MLTTQSNGKKKLQIIWSPKYTLAYFRSLVLDHMFSASVEGNLAKQHTILITIRDNILLKL